MSRPLVLAAAIAAAICAMAGSAIAPAGARADASPDASAASTAAPAGKPSDKLDAAQLPGVDLSSLDPAQREAVQAWAADAFCPCGCPHTVATCLREHGGCKHAPRAVAMAARLAAQGAGPDDIRTYLIEYYASFERSKRSKLDLKGFGPPLGSASAPITLVEFSDFTCPFCQAMRPELERFVEEAAGRVQLFYKPFPIAAHPRAEEAAETGEWARDQHIFWKMNDMLFDHAHALADDDLASYATQLGADADDLRKALADGRYKSRIAASQREAREAGLHGTPTLFFNGRRLTLSTPPSGMADLLRATLEEEEEWARNGGRWAKD
jgi:protein-disulfide isomerase